MTKETQVTWGPAWDLFDGQGHEATSRITVTVAWEEPCNVFTRRP